MDLPRGWTLDRVREVAQATEQPRLVPPDSAEVVVETTAGPEPVAASTILFVGGYHLVLPEGEDDDWLMGLAGADGRIVCWASYGTLENALRSL